MLHCSSAPMPVMRQSSATAPRSMLSHRVHAINRNNLAELADDDASGLQFPSLPKLEMPSLPKLEMPSLPKLETPSLPKLETPSLPKLEMSSLPKLEMPSLPTLEMPSLPTLEMPAFKLQPYKVEPIRLQPLKVPDHPPTQQEVQDGLWYILTHISVTGWIGIILFTALAVAASKVKIEKAEDLPPKEDAVLVLGASGRLGRLVVKKLIGQGRNVVALTRSAAKSADAFNQVGLQPGRQQKPGMGILYLQTNNDILRPEILTENPELFKGVTQVVSILGPSSNSPEGMEASAGSALVEAVTKFIPVETRNKTLTKVLDYQGLDEWENVDDINVQGKSTSNFSATKAVPSGEGAVFSGSVTTDQGGFAGVRSKRVDADLSKFDGLYMSVRGDGQSYKLNIKTTDQLALRSSMFQTTFDTVAGVWTDIYLPWHSFIKVRAASTENESFIDSSKIAKIGFSLSRFDFNGASNPYFRPGKFRLEFDGPVQAYKDPRPQLIMVSSAGCERSALIGDDVARRAQDPNPVVRANPVNTLTYKFFSEGIIRGSGHNYSVVRLTPLTDDEPDLPYELESSQGDTMVGSISRSEAAEVIVQAVQRPESVGKTFEVRRSQATDGKKKYMSKREWLRFFLKLQPDRVRFRYGMNPQPKMPPPPVELAMDRQKSLAAELERISNLRVKSQAAIQEAEARKKQQEEDAAYAKQKK